MPRPRVRPIIRLKRDLFSPSSWVFVFVGRESSIGERVAFFVPSRNVAVCFDVQFYGEVVAFGDAVSFLPFGEIASSLRGCVRTGFRFFVLSVCSSFCVT